MFKKYTFSPFFQIYLIKLSCAEKLLSSKLRSLNELKELNSCLPGFKLSKFVYQIIYNGIQLL